MSRALTELLPDVILSAPGCPPMVALQALSGATREFLTRTEAWKVWVSGKDLVANQANVSWPNHLDDAAQAQYMTLRVDALQWAATGRDIPYKTHDQLQQIDAQWRTRTGPEVKYWTQETAAGSHAQVRLTPVPEANVTDALVARLVIITHSYAGIGANANDDLEVSLPDDLFHRYRDDLVNGALARLYRMPGRDWTDKSLAEYHRRLFEDALTPAKSEADNDFTAAVHTVRYGGY